MKMNNTFQPRRLALLLKRDFYIQYRTYLVALGALFGVLFIANVASIVSADSWNFNDVFYPLSLFLGGFVFTSSSFNELNEPRDRAFYLGLPASTLEKFASKLIVTGPGFAFVSLVLYFIFSLSVYALTNLIFGMGHGLFDPFAESVWSHIRVYLATQSIFLLGAVWFRKNPLLKTVLLLFVMMVGYALFVALTVYLFYAAISTGTRPFIAFKIFDLPLHEGARIPGTLLNILAVADCGFQVLFRYGLAPFLWTVSYCRLMEQEVPG